MDNEQDKWRNLFHQAQDYKNTSDGIIDELQRGGSRYIDPEHIAEGGMKDIYSVQDSTTGRRVALAVLKKESSKILKENFLREARITAFLQHPNIMPVYDIGIDDGGTPYFTMKLSRGESLQQIINKLRQNNSEYKKKYPLTALIQIFRKVCEAVASAHSKGVIHLDIKPDNIQISSFGEVLLCDWGLSKITNADIDAPESLSDMDSLDMSEVSSVTRHDEIKGTPGYMAPEQANPRKGRRDTRTDTFALGAVLYSLLTLELPYLGKTVKDITLKTARGKIVPPRKRTPHKEIPVSLEAVVMKAMSRKPLDRYSSADDIIVDIESWQNGFATGAESAGVVKQIVLLYKRNTLFCNTLLAFLFITFLIFSFFLFKQRILLNEISNKEQATKNALNKLKEEKKIRDKLIVDRQVSKIHLARKEFDLKSLEEAVAVIFEIEPYNETALAADALVNLCKLNLRSFKVSAQQTKDKTIKKIYSKVELDLDEFYRNPTSRSDTVLSICNSLKGIMENKLSRRIMSVFLSFHGDLKEQSKLIEKIVRRYNPAITKLNMEVSSYDDGIYINLSDNPELKNVNFLSYMPIRKLNISSTGVSRLEFTEPMLLKSLNISFTSIYDLNILRDSQLEEFYLDRTPVKSLWIIKDVPLKRLSIQHTPIQDLTILNRITTLERVILVKSNYPQKVLENLSPNIRL